MTIGTPDSARISLQTSMPSFPGSIRSSSTTSGRYSRKSDSARVPVVDTRESKPSWRRTIVSISASAASSSTTSTRPRPAVPTPSVVATCAVLFPTARSVAVVLRLVRARHVDTEVRRLLVGELRQRDAQRVEVKPGDLFVEVLGQNVDADRVLVGLCEDLDLRKHLVRERVRHHERGVPRGVPEVHQPALGQHDDRRTTVRERPK